MPPLSLRTANGMAQPCCARIYKRCNVLKHNNFSSPACLPAFWSPCAGTG